MKQLHRFYVPAENIKKLRFLIEDESAIKHMRQVLRLEKGDPIVLFDGEGHEYDAKLGFLTKEQAAGVVNKEIKLDRTPKPAVFIAQALPRAGKFDDIVRMNTEIGVQGFVLFESEYSVAKIDNYPEAKVERLRRVALEALRQSEGIWLPDFYGPETFASALDFKADVKLVLHSRMSEQALSLKKLAETIKPEQTVLIFIGPEGGFSPTELKVAEEKGAQIVYLDLPILRTETAGIVASGILLS